jgi:molybdate transport system substrate-binding protein
MMRRIAWVFVGVMLLPIPVLGAELTILSAGAVKSVVPAIAEDFTRRTGTHVNIDFSAMGPLKAKLAANKNVDLIIVSSAVADELQQAKQIAVLRRQPVVGVGVGVVAKRGAPLPNIGSVEDFRRALLTTPVLAYGDPKLATSGAYFDRLLTRLQIGDQVKGKVRLLPDGFQVIAFIAAGDGQALGIAPITEIRSSEAEGVRLVGPLPVALQQVTTYEAVVLERGAAHAQAEAFVQALVGADARTRFAAAGYDAVP